MIRSIFWALLVIGSSAQAALLNGIWQVTAIVPAHSQDQASPAAQAWMGDTITFEEQAIIHGSQTCPAAYQAREILLNTYLREHYAIDAQALGIDAPLVQHIATGCPQPGLDPVLLVTEQQARLVVDGAFLTLTRQESAPPQTPQAPPALEPVAEWQYFTAPQAGITLRYPARVHLTQTLEYDQPGLSLSVQTNRIDELDHAEEAPFLFNRKVAEQDRNALSQGLFGEVPDFPVAGSQAVIAVNETIHTKTFAVFSQYEPCNVSFYYHAIFYVGDYQAVLTLSADVDSVVRENPQFFTRVAETCADQLIWDNTHWTDAQGHFFQALQKGEIQGLAASWYTTFQALLQQITFHPQSTTPPPLAATTANKPPRGYLNRDHRLCREILVKDPQWMAYQVVARHSFSLTLPDYGGVCFITLHRPQHGDQFILTDRRGNPLFVFPDDRAMSTLAVSFPDLNQDAIPDIILIARSPDGKYANRAYWSRPGQEATTWTTDEPLNRRLDGFRSVSAVKRFLLDRRN